MSIKTCAWKAFIITNYLLYLIGTRLFDSTLAALQRTLKMKIIILLKSKGRFIFYFLSPVLKHKLLTTRLMEFLMEF